MCWLFSKKKQKKTISHGSYSSQVQACQPSSVHCSVDTHLLEAPRQSGAVALPGGASREAQECEGEQRAGVAAAQVVSVVLRALGM